MIPPLGARIGKWLIALPLVMGAAFPQDVEAPDRAAIEARIAALSEDESEDTRVELGRWKDALGALTRAASLKKRKAEFELDVEQAPQRLLVLRADLELARAAEPGKAPAGATVKELEALVSEARSARLLAEAHADEIALVAESRRTRTEVLPTELSNARAELSEHLTDLPTLDAQARESGVGVLARAEIVALRAEVDAILAEQRALEAQKDTLANQAELSAIRAAVSQQTESTLQADLARRRRVEAEQAAARARDFSAEVIGQVPELARLAAESEELAAMRVGTDGLAQRLERVNLALERNRNLRADVESRAAAMRDRLSAGGTGTTTGRLLRRDAQALPTDRQTKALRRERLLQRSDAEIELLDLKERKRALEQPLERTVTRILDAARAEGLADAEQTTRDIVEQHRSLLDDAIEESEELVRSSRELARGTVQYCKDVTAYREVIDRRILWIQSVAPAPLRRFLQLPRDVAELASAVQVRESVGAAAKRTQIGPSLAWLFVAALLFWIQRPLRRTRTEITTLVRGYRTDSFRHTLRALALSVLSATVTVFGFAALARVAGELGPEIHPAFTAAVIDLAPSIFTLLVARELLGTGSVAEGHLRWPPRRVVDLRRELRWFVPVYVILGIAALTVSHMEHFGAADSLGRILFVAWMAATSVYLSRTFAEFKASAEGRSGAAWSLARFGRMALVAGPILLAAASITGFAYTALRLEERQRASLIFGAVMVVIATMFQRWLFIVRRRIAVAQARERAEERAREALEENASEIAPLDVDRIDIPAADAQTRQLFRSMLTMSAVVGIYLLWSSTLPALRGLDRIQLLPQPAILATDSESAVPAATRLAATPSETAASPDLPLATPLRSVTGAEEADEPASQLGLPTVVTLADLSLALVLAFLAFVAAKNLPGLLELTLLRRLPLDVGARYAVSTLLRYLIIIAGISAVSGTLGFGWSQIQWLAAALTFGLAFGLQEIFANFVSGLIILIERPVRVGDIVTVSGQDGRVTRLRMRATTIQDWDRREYLIPNKEFITGTVVNWTLSDPITRIIIPVGVAYGSDTRRARRLLTEVARGCPGVLTEPAPHALFRAFGDSTLDMELRVFIPNRELMPVIKDRLHEAIDDAFRNAGIEIAFPQRDLHLRSVDEGVAEHLRGGGETSPGPEA